MTELLQEQISKKWGQEYPVIQVHELSETDYDKCIVVGTLFKDQKLKPSILKQLADTNNLIPQPIVSHFTDESDSLHIEDEVQRYALMGPMAAHEKLVTGITCAVLGTDMGKGRFMVHEMCFAEFRPQIDRPIEGEDRFVIFLSGLNLIEAEKCVLPLQLLVNFISGLLGNVNGVNPSKIARLIIAGDSIRNGPAKSMPTISLISKSVVPTDSVQAVQLLDSTMSRLCQFIDVDIMPGKHDPTNHVLPQKPLHHCMFPKTRPYKSFNRVSNPYDCEIDGWKFLGSSGQPVNDILAFSDIEDPLEALENCLKWSHIAPTAPDTLGCYPYYEIDPFIIKECPHVVFAGNQERFDSKLAVGGEGQTVRLIAVPRFSSTYTAVVLNLKNLECTPIMFN